MVKDLCQEVISSAYSLSILRFLTHKEGIRLTHAKWEQESKRYDLTHHMVRLFRDAIARHLLDGAGSEATCS